MGQQRRGNAAGPDSQNRHRVHFAPLVLLSCTAVLLHCTPLARVPQPASGHRIFSVLIASIENRIPTIQKRITTLVSGHPSFSKW